MPRWMLRWTWLGVWATASCGGSSGGAGGEGEAEAEAEAESEAEAEAEAEGEACEPGGGPFADALVQTGIGPQHNEIQDVTWAGDTLYVCGNLSGLTSVGLADPAIPGPAMPLALPAPAPNTCNHVIGDLPALWVSNHVDHIHPSFVARVVPDPTSVYRAGGTRNYEGIAQASGFVYVAAHADGVFVLDATTLDDVDQFTAGIANAWSVAVDAGVVWVGDQDALRAFDTAGVALGSAPVPGLVQDIAISGTTAWLALGPGGIASVDISNPAVPALLAQIDTPGSALAVSVDGSLLAVADWDGVSAYSIEDAAAPVLAGAETGVGDRVLAVAAGGGYVYAGEWRRVYAFAADASARGPEVRIEPEAQANLGRVDAGVATDFRFALRNDGTECLVVDSIAVESGAPIEVDSATPPIAIAPGEFEFVTLLVTPSSASPAEATVTLTTNDPDEPSVDLMVQWNQPGVGVGDPAVDFVLPDQDGTLWTLAGCAGSCVVFAYFATA